MENKLFTIVNKEDEARFLADLNANPDNFNKKLIFVFSDSVNYIMVNGEKFVSVEYVDLGLPSGLKWAKCNIGTNVETEPGLYFSWGDTEVHKHNSSYKFTLKNYVANGLDKISTNLTLSQDASNVILGGVWRMPTKIEFEELYNNTNITWTTINGVNGCKFTNKTDNSKYIFMPASGIYNNGSAISRWGEYGGYWSSTFFDSSRAWRFDFVSDSQGMYNGTRYIGCPIRGVCK